MNTQEQQQEPKKKIPVKPYSLGELAAIYGVCGRTLKKWISEFKDEVGERKGRYYTIPQVKIIFSNLCLPHEMDVDGN